MFISRTWNILLHSTHIYIRRVLKTKLSTEIEVTNERNSINYSDVWWKNFFSVARNTNHKYFTIYHNKLAQLHTTVVWGKRPFKIFFNDIKPTLAEVDTFWTICKASSSFPVGIYLLKASNGNTKRICKIFRNQNEETRTKSLMPLLTLNEFHTLFWYICRLNK